MFPLMSEIVNSKSVVRYSRFFKKETRIFRDPAPVLFLKDKLVFLRDKLETPDSGSGFF